MENLSQKVSIFKDLDDSNLKNTALSSSEKMLNLENCDRISFYGKAKKQYTSDKRYISLFSYNTLICTYDLKTKALHTSANYWNYSNTTKRHEKSFLSDIFNGNDLSINVYNRLKK